MGAREAWLRAEVERLGRVIEADPRLLVSFDARADWAEPHVEIEPGGAYHWIVRERGEVLEDRVTNDPDELLYWSFVATARQMASTWAADNGDPAEDFRIAWYEQTQRLLLLLDRRWAARWNEEERRAWPENIDLLPPPPQ